MIREIREKRLWWLFFGSCYWMVDGSIPLNQDTEPQTAPDVVGTLHGSQPPSMYELL